MAFPRPSRPSVAYRDLKAFLAGRSRHQLGFAAASIAIPLLFVLLFHIDREKETYRPPRVYWVETLDGSRSDAEIRAQQVIDAKARKEREEAERKELEARRAPFKAIDKKMDELGL